MAYTKQYSKTNWVNNQAPAINATNLNKIEEGIDNVDTELVSQDSRISNLEANEVDATGIDAGYVPTADGQDGWSWGELTLGIDEDDGLLYLYANGVRCGEGIEVGGSTTRYTITYNLATNIVSSNTAGRIAEGNSYATVISSSHADYQVDDITVTMGGSDITATAVSGNEIAIASVTANVAITVTALFYPAVEIESNAMTIQSGGTGTMRIRLHAQPAQTQTVSVFSDTLTLSASSLTFTAANWDTYQSITVTAPSVDSTTYDYISVINSDPLMTESTVMVTVTALGYEDYVDTTIPTANMHTVTLDDFTSTAAYGNYIRLYGYNAEYTNVKVPATLDGKTVIVCGSNAGPSTSNSTFYGNTTIQYVTFEDGVLVGEGGAPLSNNAYSLFTNCTSLIGISNFPTSVINLDNTFGGTSALRFIDNLDECVNVTSIAAFASSGIEYIQDLSALTALTNIQAAFRSNTNLKKVFGLPELATTTANATNMFSGCTGLQYGIVPKGVNNLSFAFYNCSSMRRCDIFEDNLTTSQIPSASAFYGTRNLEIYCNANTTTHESLLSNFGSSTQITIKTFGSTSVTPSIVVWGDSISSANKAWIEWPKRLQTKLGTNDYLVKNEALAGEWSTSTTARQGGYAMTASAFTIPADTTATEITFSTVTLKGTETFTPLAAGPIFSAGASFNPCTIAGVKGTITKDNSKYYFTRLESGTAVSVSEGTAITSDNDTVFNAADNVMIFYLNGNAGWDDDADKLLEMCQNAVDHFEDLGGTKYIVAGPAANVALTNGSVKAEVIEFEGKAATAFGNHWLNLREYEIQNGLTQNGLTASALDTERMADGLVPASLVGGGSTTNILMYDGTTVTDQNHPNVYGANTIMLAFYEKGVALGYWS